jgi:cobalt/nickel transport system permease protein
MRHEFFDHHREGTSIVHRLDPRLKLLVLLSFIFVTVLIPYSRKQLFVIYGFVPVILAFISGVSIFHYLSKLSKLYPMIFIITIFIPFFPGNSAAVYQLGLVKIYPDGLQKFLLINVKAILTMMMTIVMISTTDLTMLLKGMEKLRVPRMFISILSFMYRFIFLLIDETERMSMAYHSRYLKMSFTGRIKTFGQLIGILFIRTYERGERIYLAMESRGFKGRVYTMSEIYWKKSDTLVTLIFIITLTVPFILEYF